MTNIALISCGRKKLSYRTKAENMYISTLFKNSLKYAKDILKANKIFILSAKYGLLSLDKEIDPYNVTLINMGKEERQRWEKIL
jgi:hypothetical protein